MKYILTPTQMRTADATAINDFNIPGIILMENAARSSAETIYDLLEIGSSVLLLCGSGNNGGDGFALARHLHEDYDVKVIWIGREDKMSPETHSNYLSVKNLGIPLMHLNSEEEILDSDFEVDCIIDSMIGVGGSEFLKGLPVPILKKANSVESLRIAIDSPTGLNTETGLAHEDCFYADYTITMFAAKTGMLIKDGIEVCGEIQTAYLGAPQHIVKKISNTYILEKSDIAEILPERNKISSKFDYGRALIVAGSKNYPGAAALSSNAAITIGTGLVYLMTPVIHAAVLPEVIPAVVPHTESGTISIKALDAIIESSKKANAIAIGPGFGTHPETIELVKELIKSLPENLPIVIDADGLKAISMESVLRKNIILTPHTGEFSQISCIPRQEVEKNAPWLAKEWAEKLNCTILLKHVPSIITDGKVSYWNTNGNPGMATAGSGDVLTGIIAGLLALNVEPLEAAALGAFLHASAGDFYAETFSEQTLTASELITSLKEVLKEL
jgi:ADP-dependent NAD(P)H-hydrate dehydratase / NAD(P)H-hydrate epimerase